MNKIWILAKKELKTFFDSLLAYILLVLFIGITGFFTWIMISDILSNGQASLEQFFFVSYFTFFIFIPALTMGMFAEEKRSGTIELLLTKSISDWQVVMGKMMAVFVLILIALLLTSPYYFSVMYLGDNVDHGAIWCGYLALILLSLASIGVGLFTSSITSNQIVALLLSWGIMALFQLFFWFIAMGTGGVVSNLMDYLSSMSHFQSMYQGVIDTRDIVYFLSIFFAGMLLTEAQLSKRHQA